MKVALVMERVEPWRGGAETSTQQFMQHLLDMGLDLELLTRSRVPSRPRLQVHTLKGSGSTRAGRSAGFARAVDRLAPTLNVDLVHALSPCLCADVYQPRGGTVAEAMVRNVALRRTRTARSLKRFTARLNLRQQLMLDLERRLLTRRPPPMVLALSDYVIRQLETHYAFPAASVRKVFNGVNPDPTPPEQRERDRIEVRETYGVPADALLVLEVAHNFKLKGVGQWIQALGSLSISRDLPEVHSLIVGRDKPMRWQRQAAACRVDGRVRFVGATQRILAFYHAADMLVHPTYYDPCSRVVLEAMASGLACITTAYDGASEAVDQANAGYVLDDPDDVDALADRVRRLADSEKRLLKAERGVKQADRHSMKQHAEGVVRVYEEVLSQRARA